MAVMRTSTSVVGPACLGDGRHDVRVRRMGSRVLDRCGREGESWEKGEIDSKDEHVGTVVHPGPQRAVNKWKWKAIKAIIYGAAQDVLLSPLSADKAFS